MPGAHAGHSSGRGRVGLLFQGGFWLWLLEAPHPASTSCSTGPAWQGDPSGSPRLWGALECPVLGTHSCLCSLPRGLPGGGLPKAALWLRSHHPPGEASTPAPVGPFLPSLPTRPAHMLLRSETGVSFRLACMACGLAPGEPRELVVWTRGPEQSSTCSECTTLV